MVLLCASACSAATTPTAGAQPEKTATKSAIPARLNLARGVVVVQTATAPLRFRVELALTGQERERGLMYREVLADDEGDPLLLDHMRPAITIFAIEPLGPQGRRFEEMGVGGNQSIAHGSLFIL